MAGRAETRAKRNFRYAQIALRSGRMGAMKKRLYRSRNFLRAGRGWASPVPTDRETSIKKSLSTFGGEAQFLKLGTAKERFLLPAFSCIFDSFLLYCPCADMAREYLPVTVGGWPSTRKRERGAKLSR